MAMVCPQCNGSFDQRLQCPACGVRLVYQSARRPGAPARSWQGTPWGRIVVGLLLSQGLYYGLRQLCTAGLLISGDEAARSVWATLYGLVLMQALQALGLLAGGTLAGAGQRQGAVYGAVVGVWNGVISVVVLQASSPTFNAVALYGQPILHTVFGVVGGLVGSLIWKPLPTVTLPGSAVRLKAPAVVPLRSSGVRLDGPIAWARVLAGTALAVGGTVWATVILDLVLDASSGELTVTSHLQARLVTWEISGLAILGGGALGGATMANAVKQGLCVGLFTGALLFGIRVGSPEITLDLLLLTLVGTLALGLVGGWFGGQLFPPLVAGPRRKRLGPASL